MIDCQCCGLRVCGRGMENLMKRIVARFRPLLLVFLLGSTSLVSAAAFAQGADALGHMADLESGIKSKRIASWDKSGGNADFLQVKAGATVTLAEMSGAGSVRHIWVTINSASPTHLRELVLRMYWDGEADPSVEVPIGDFFGTGFEFEDIAGGHYGQKYQSWQSLPITVQDRAMNCYWEMPYSKGARITLSNDGEKDVDNFYYHVDYQQYDDGARVANKGRFHVQWRREVTRAVPDSESKGVNLDGLNNYQFMHATGKGQYVGTILSIQGHSTGWWGEGDDMFFVDGASSPPSINGTGLEDYFNNAWMFQQEFHYPMIGYTVKGNRDWTGVHAMYRFHVQDPVYFDKSLRAGIEHGHANRRSDEFTSVAFWYQSEPHEKLEPLPGLKERLPHPSWKIELLPENLPN